MIDINLLYALFAFLLFLFAALGLMREYSYRRLGLTAIFLVMVGMSYFAFADLLSRPKPVVIMLEWDTPQNMEEAKVVGHKMVEGEAIYLLLDWEGSEYPRYFQFPWDDEMAQQLQDALQKNREQGGEGVIMELPFDKSLDRREHDFFHPLPQPKQMFPKPNREDDVLDYEHPGEAA